MTEVSIQNEAFDAIVQKAVLEALGSQGQALIIKEALAYLTKKDTGGYYSDKKSPIMRALETACDRIANTVLIEKLTNDAEFTKQIEEIYSEAFKKLFGAENREAIIKKLCGAMSAALSKLNE